MPVASINGFQMHYRVEGQGPPLVMTHGLLSSMAMVDALGEMPPSLKESFSVISYDVRGHGQSGHTTDPADYTWHNLAEDLYQLLRNLGIERAHVGGGSIGAGTSLVFALKHPEMVDKLVLVPPPPIGQQASAPSASMFGGLALLIEGLGLEEAADVALRLPPWGALRESAPPLFEMIRQWLLSQNPEGIVPAIRGIVNGPALAQEDFGELKAPTLIVAYPDDEMHPLVSAELLHKAIPDSRLVVAPNLIHYRLHPEELAQIIKGFLDDE